MAENKPQPAKEDQRVRLTKALLRQAFLQLLAQKPVQSITVKQLCESAGINRGTFYLHYRDVYDLLEQMQTDLLAELEVLLAETPVIVSGSNRQESSDFIGALYGFFERNRELCSLLLGEHGDPKFVTAIVARAREMAVAGYQQRFPRVSRQRAEIFYDFIAWGFLGLIRRSLQNPGGPSLDTVAAEAEHIIAQAARYFEM